MNSILIHWKSTLSGLLTVSLSTTAAFLAPPLNSLISAKYVLWIGAFQVIGKIWIAAIQVDADKITTPDIIKANAEVINPASKPSVASKS